MIYYRFQFHVAVRLDVITNTCLVFKMNPKVIKTEYTNIDNFEFGDLLLTYKVPETFLDKESTFQNKYLYCVYAFSSKDGYKTSKL